MDLSRVVAGHRPSGLVNAVMRKISQRDWAGWVSALAPQDAVGRLAFERGYPSWVAVALLDALGGDDHRPMVLRGLDEPRQPPFKAETVDDEELGLRQQAYLVRARLEDMLVCIAADEASHRDVATADFIHDVLENAERHEHPHRGIGC